MHPEDTTPHYVAGDTERGREAEVTFEALARVKGWEPCRGWPDYVCFGPDGALIAVEVKARNPRTGILAPLGDTQLRVLTALQRLGLRCYLSDGATLEPFKPEVHGTLRRQASRARHLGQQRIRVLAPTRTGATGDAPALKPERGSQAWWRRKRAARGY